MKEAKRTQKKVCRNRKWIESDNREKSDDQKRLEKRRQQKCTACAPYRTGEHGFIAAIFSKIELRLVAFRA